MSERRKPYRVRNRLPDHLAAGSMPLSRVETARRLRAMRETIECELRMDGLEGELSAPQAAMLMDVCRALGLDGPQMLSVLGLAYYTLTGVGVRYAEGET